MRPPRAHFVFKTTGTRTGSRTPVATLKGRTDVCQGVPRRVAEGRFDLNGGVVPAAGCRVVPPRVGRTGNKWATSPALREGPQDGERTLSEARPLPGNASAGGRLSVTG